MASKITAFVSHEDIPRHDTGWNHPDHQGRIPAIARAVYRDMLTLFEPMLELSAVPATDEDLRLVHTAEYVRRVREAAGAQAAEIDGVRISGASDEAARASVGGALTAVDAVLGGDVRNAFVLARPPGRDALPDAAAGFSIFNTVAIAARHLRERRGTRSVLVVSWGSSPATHLRSVLAAPWLQMIDIHTPQEGAAFADALRDALGALPSAPGFVLLSAGFDILAGDPVGTLAVEPREVYDITRVLREWADQHASGRLVSVLEGGYDATATARAVVQHLRALIGLPPA
ncbi:MAG: Acetylspermidine deacetylase; Deacetylases, including yeast histone deacetylase and acetoin utilization protein [uncultured Gemmatimonadetes bacterium]|uniref:Acetylspermidine deacetylase Deacetylases, including yeast histone deacetylase and acetoin utilization protein n=1 Tax=uncultured Gemmatimonadota bacterium TaxID=203437 RepID=A0A6J4LZ57_9BACT|nr:MAG: Acetylspermidine deacetylase; Deacetylases, including yeast histone deacetylase and acetoin utilization protein [uncultured Gemmatimonadota bacterium]